MALRKATLLFLVFMSAGAESLEWEILPGECLVTDAKEYCDTQVNVAVKHASAVYPCLIIDKVKAGCFSASRPILSFNMRIEADVEFTAVNESGEMLGHYILPHKVIDSTPRRRRVRLPWSVF